MSTSKAKEAKKSPKAMAIILPLLAGFLHLQVFYYAAFRCISRALFNSSASDSTSDEFRHECFLLDRAIFLAYMFDLLCCYLKVIPFSRCSRSGDIIGHHVPTLILALPLAIPLWANVNNNTITSFFGYYEATSFEILDLDIGNEQRNHFINAYTLASGFAYISSLNEVIMCFQRVEMSLAGVDKFRDIALMKNHFFTSRFAVGFELLYKLCFFWGLSIIACKACCDFDKSLYDSIAMKSSSSSSSSSSIWGTLVTIYSSPAVLRGALFRAFSIVMYPSMGMKCLRKFQQFQREGEQVKSA